MYSICKSSIGLKAHMRMQAFQATAPTGKAGNQEGRTLKTMLKAKQAKSRIRSLLQNTLLLLLLLRKLR